MFLLITTISSVNLDQFDILAVVQGVKGRFMEYLVNNIIAIVALIIAMLFLFHKKIRSSPQWHATVTPLASIIGSGFLISTPLLIYTTGKSALFVMIAIVMLAYAFGSSLRFNIQYVEPRLDSRKDALWLNRIEVLSRPILGVAYIISVAFYLKLLSAFALRGFGISDPLYGNILTTSLLLLIGIVGKLRGLSMLELLETYSVNTKLAIIFSLLMAHFFYNSELVIRGKWWLSVQPHDSLWMGFRKVLGMLIIIQGFETSRYLGQEYSADMRIKTMRYAQLISGGIYIIFMAVAMVVFNQVETISETVVIDLSGVVAPVLPALLIVASVMSQFSAAVADTLGSGGLLSEASHHRISDKNSYLILAMVAVSLTWLTNIYEITTIASKAFAAYYALQLCLTLIALQHHKQLEYRWLKTLFYLMLLIIMVLVVVLGVPVEA